MSTEKKLAFSFSKTKKTLNLNDNKTTSAKLAFDTSISKLTIKSGSGGTRHSDDEDEGDNKDLILSIENNKVNSTKADKNEKKVPIVPLLASTKRTKEDIEAIKALIADSKKDLTENLKEKNENLKVDLNEDRQLQTTDTVETVEDPNYEQINIDDFGMACLRGMGWKETDGIGISNKRKVKMVEPELRPRGLGLGANLNKKHKGDEDQSSINDKLVIHKRSIFTIAWREFTRTNTPN